MSPFPATYQNISSDDVSTSCGGGVRAYHSNSKPLSSLMKKTFLNTGRLHFGPCERHGIRQFTQVATSCFDHLWAGHGEAYSGDIKCERAPLF